jgi:hypothetical protein
MLRTQYVRIRHLRIFEILRMHQIFERYYDHGPIDVFLGDLHKKDGVFLVRRERDDKIVGFSTLGIYHFEHEGRQVKGLFSGDTIIEKEYWGTRTLQSAFARKLLVEALKRPLSKQYWLLISKGYKTYLLLTRNFPIFYPDRRVEHHGLKELVASYCERLYPGKLDHARMVLDFGPQANCLKDSVADIPPELLARDADIAHFAALNPGWVHGQELPCIAQADLFTFAKAIVPFIRKALRPRPNRAVRVPDSVSGAASD